MLLMRNSVAVRSVRAAAALLVAAAALAGCAISKDVRLETQGAVLPVNSAISIDTAPSGDPVAERFATALAAALIERGHSVTNAAPVTAVFGFTQRDRAIGAADGSPPAGPPASGAGSAPLWISQPQRRGLFQSCKGERLRATLALYSRADNVPIYRASGEIDGCAFTEADLDRLARALVAGSAASVP